MVSRGRSALTATFDAFSETRTPYQIAITARALAISKKKIRLIGTGCWILDAGRWINQ
jgi:hypothetical protein